MLFPPNITGIEIHFTPGASNTLFEVSLKGKYATVNAFVRCVAMGTSGCIYKPDPALWSAISIGNAGQGDVSLVVRGTDDTGTSVGDSSTFHMQFSKDNIDGALYYWTTSGKSAIMRWDFSGNTQAAQAYLTPANTNVTSCIGCHALAPNGDAMVVSANGQGDGRLLLWDIATNKARMPYPLTQRSQFESWNSDGTQFVGVYGDAQSTTRPRQGGAGRPDDLRWHDRHENLDHRPGGPPRRSPRLVEEHRRPEHHRVHLGRRHRRHQRSAPRHRRHRLRAVRRHRLGGAADAGPLAAGEEPLLPGHRARRQSGRLRRIDLQRDADGRAWLRTCPATPTPTPRRRCS